MRKSVRSKKRKEKKTISKFNKEQGFIIVRTLRTLHINSDQDSESLIGAYFRLYLHHTSAIICAHPQTRSCPLQPCLVVFVYHPVSKTHRQKFWQAGGSRGPVYFPGILQGIDVNSLHGFALNEQYVGDLQLHCWHGASLQFLSRTCHFLQYTLKVYLFASANEKKHIGKLVAAFDLACSSAYPVSSTQENAKKKNIYICTKPQLLN